jgi:hypothetical protein
MSVVCILTPVVIAAWPAFSAAVVAAASSLGYAVVDGENTSQSQVKAKQKIQLEMAQSELVTGSIGRDRKISVFRDGVTVTFSRDARGKASLCVAGDGHGEAELRALGEELAQCVVQKYVLHKLMTEMQARGFHVVEEEIAEDRSIRLKVRHWEN